MRAMSSSIQVASWSNGWTMSRVVSRTYAVEWKLRNPEVRPVFVIQDPKRKIVYEVVVSEIPHVRSMDYVQVSIVSDEQDPVTAFPGPEARQVGVSALAEVLGLRLNSRYLYRDALLVPQIKPADEIQDALAKETGELAERVKTLADIHDHQMQISNPSERLELRTQRRLYQNTAVNGFRWALNLNRFRKGMEAIASDPRGEEVSNREADGIGLIRNGQVSLKTGNDPVRSVNFELHLKLFFCPEPVWFVSVEEERRLSSRPISSEVLVSDDRGPTHALMKAGLLLTAPDDDRFGDKAMEDWVDDKLEDAPELTEDFDVEAYRLVNASTPLLWDFKRFVAWVQEESS